MVKIPRLPGPPDPSSPPLVEISMQPRQTWQRHAFPVPTAVRLLVASQGLDVVARWNRCWFQKGFSKIEKILDDVDLIWLVDAYILLHWCLILMVTVNVWCEIYLRIHIYSIYWSMCNSHPRSNRIQSWIICSFLAIPMRAQTQAQKWDGYSFAGYWFLTHAHSKQSKRYQKGFLRFPPSTNICIYSWMSLTVCLYVQKIYVWFNCLLTYASNLLLFLRIKGMNDLGNSSGTGKQPIFPEEHHPKTDGRDASR